jgi:hypothetical protein
MGCGVLEEPKSYDGEKASSSINLLIFSDIHVIVLLRTGYLRVPGLLCKDDLTDLFRIDILTDK